jgi:hypothetical protein
VIQKHFHILDFLLFITSIWHISNSWSLISRLSAVYISIIAPSRLLAKGAVGRGAAFLAQGFGAGTLFPKPFDVDRLLQVVKHYLNLPGDRGHSSTIAPYVRKAIVPVPQ